MDKTPLIPKEHVKLEEFDKSKYSNLLVLDSKMVQDEKGFLPFFTLDWLFGVEESRQHSGKTQFELSVFIVFWTQFLFQKGGSAKRSPTNEAIWSQPPRKPKNGFSCPQGRTWQVQKDHLLQLPQPFSYQLQSHDVQLWEMRHDEWSQNQNEPVHLREMPNKSHLPKRK